MAKPTKKQPEKVFIVIPTNDLGEMESGCFNSVDVLGSGHTAKEAVDCANAEFDVRDAPEDGEDIVVVELHIVEARPLSVEKKLVDYSA